MNNITKGQDRELTKIASMFYNEMSKEKGHFPKDKSFSVRDKMQLLKNGKMAFSTIISVLKTPRVIKEHKTDQDYTSKICKNDFNNLHNLIQNEMGMDTWGVAELSPQDVFKGQGVPFKYAIVMSKNMDNDMFAPKSLPNMGCQLEVMKIYGKVGVAALAVTKYLRQHGYAAAPNHGLGGNIDYVKAGMDANLGFIGKHGLLITPENGPCNRLSVVYTNIENLKEFLNNEQDHSWGYEFCKTCHKCVNKCPYEAIYDDNLVDQNGNVESISNEKCNAGFSHYGCGVCIGVCPFTSSGYVKIYKAFKKNNRLGDTDP